MSRKYQSYIDRMNTEEKCALLTGGAAFATRAYQRYGIPAMEMSDGPHGLRKQAEGANHLGIGASVPATCFPTAVGVANSWNETLAEEVGAALGEEALAQQIGIVLGPGLNIKRSPLCGRNFEYFSEDPYLSGKITAAYVRGIQSKGVSACPKHFAVNSQELKRMANDSVLDERTLRELYLTGFEIAVREGEPRCLMTSYNRVNGTYANENAHLLDDILRKEWGYRGMVVTDWGGSNDHVEGVRAGSTLEMPAPVPDAVRELTRAVREGRISEEIVNDRVEELLSVVIPACEAIAQAERTFDEEAHHALAKKAAAESFVLLKNKDRLLPLAPGTRVAVIGDFAFTPRYQGAGSSQVNPTRLISPMESLRESLPEITGSAKGFKRNGEADEALLEEACRVAQDAEVVLLFLGLDELKESEGLDRPDMKINENQITLFRKLAESGKRVAVILAGGSVMELPFADDADAILYTALSGQAGAQALADVLTGKENPSGKLAESWAYRLEDTPAFRYYPGRGRISAYREGMFAGYRYYDTAEKDVRFPFGFGLSYTEFTYSDLYTDAAGAHVLVTNTGERDGAEIVQMYVSRKTSQDGTALLRPAQELKGFCKVFLRAGEAREVTIPFDKYTFRYFDTETGRFETEEACFEIRIGASSRDIRLTEEYAVKGHVPGEKAKEIPACYRRAEVTDVSDADFESLIGRKLPDDKVKIDRSITLGELSHGRSPIGWIVAAVLRAKLKKSAETGHPDLNTLFVYNMPLRAIAKMTNGAVSMGMVDGIVWEVKGFWIIGLLRVLAEAVKNAVQNAAQEKRLKG